MEKTYNGRRQWSAGYKNYPCDERFCFYCNEPATGFDHCPPLAMVAVLTLRPDLFKQNRWLVPACIECNSTLAAKSYFTLADRCDALVQAYDARYCRIASWTDKELLEMSEMFRIQILVLQEAKRIASDRIVNILTRRKTL